MVLEDGRFGKTHPISFGDGDIKLHPARFNNTYAHWLNNIRIGISPVNCGGDNKFRRIFMVTERRFCSCETIEEALKLAQKTSNFSLITSDLRQDVDALDTWFSSWLANVRFGGIMDPREVTILNTITHQRFG
jgi:valyl-tRNA synthetase